MSRPLRGLHVEDSEDDAELILRGLRKGGFDLTVKRVETESDYLAGLDQVPDLILANYFMPQFGAWRALALKQVPGLDIPFIVISGQISAEVAVTLMKAGAHDYLFKHDLIRHVPAVQRELRETRMRAEQRQAEAALRDSEEKLRLIMENVGDLVVMLDTEGRRLYASASYQTLFDDPDGWQGTDSFAEAHPEDQERVRQVFRKTVTTGSGQRCEFRLVLKDRGVRYVESQGSVILEDSGQVSKVVLVSRDVTKRKQAEARIQYLTHTDGLTGLPNRALLTERIGQALAQTERNKQYLALMFIDLDYFKTINDSLGHQVGDKLLKQVAARLSQCMRQSDFLARLGGDEFLMMLSGLQHTWDAAQVAQKIVPAHRTSLQRGRPRAQHLLQYRHKHLSKRWARRPDLDEKRRHGHVSCQGAGT
jgi:diguanylate cyclase (GGDEF)-like protein/PAS domain S-box-containing protein